MFPGDIGYQSMTVVNGFNQAYRFEQSRNLQLPSGKRVVVPADAKEFQLEPLELIPTKSISGKLVDETGDPIANAPIYAWNKFKTANDFTRTDEEGVFTFDRLPSAYPPKVFKVGPQYKSKPAKVLSRNPLVIQFSNAQGENE